MASDGDDDSSDRRLTGIAHVGMWINEAGKLVDGQGGPSADSAEGRQARGKKWERTRFNQQDDEELANWVRLAQNEGHGVKGLGIYEDLTSVVSPLRDMLMCPESKDAFPPMMTSPLERTSVQRSGCLNDVHPIQSSS
jgi:hypothetical protein